MAIVLALFSPFCMVLIYVYLSNATMRKMKIVSVSFRNYREVECHIHRSYPCWHTDCSSGGPKCFYLQKKHYWLLQLKCRKHLHTEKHKLPLPPFFLIHCSQDVLNVLKHRKTGYLQILFENTIQGKNCLLRKGAMNVTVMRTTNCPNSRFLFTSHMSNSAFPVLAQTILSTGK